MAKERLKSPRARLFVALELPDRVRKALARWQLDALTDPALRAPASETLHVTLCFLGYVAERRIAEVAAIVAGLEARPVEMRFEAEPIAIPRNRPRLFAADAPSEAADELAAEASGRLEAARLYKREKRPFWSHVTLARVRSERTRGESSGRRRGGRPMAVSDPLPALPDELLEPFGCVRLTLYRSILRPQGAEYLPLASLDLPSRDTSGTKKE
jgi:2'-5' RNA ligase